MHIMRTLLFIFLFTAVCCAAASAQSLQGDIFIAAPAGQGPDEFAGGHFQVELWHVNYGPDKQNMLTTDIRLKQKVNANINVQLSSNGLHYTIANAPSGTDLAIIVYVGSQPDNTPLRILGIPSDGQQADKNHTYKSDAKKFLGRNIAFGVYSLSSPDAGRPTADFRVMKAGGPACRQCDAFGDFTKAVGDAADDAVDATVKFVTKTINGVEHTFDQTVDGVAGLSKVVAQDIQGLANTANFFIDEAGRFYYLTAIGLDNLILYGNLPRTRDISDQEYAWANSMIYNGTLPAKYRIKIFNFMHIGGDGHRFYTWPAPASDYIYVNIGDAFDDPMHYTNTAYPSPGQAFIHELGHAWQCGRYGFNTMLGRYFSAPGGLKQTYDPGCAVNNAGSSYNLEQEATLIDRSYVELYYPEKQDGYSCSFSIPWVEQHVRNGVAFNKVSNPVVQQMLAVSGPTGGPANWTLNHSAGNPTDGDGFFMLGRNPNSFLYYSNKTKIAASNWGVIRDRFTKANYEFGVLGWPARSELLLPDGVGYYQQFDHGFIYWHPKYGAYVVMKNFFDLWAKDGWERGKLGYPVADANMQGTDHGYQMFAGGVIFLNESSGRRPGDGGSFTRYGDPNILVKEYLKTDVGSRVMINPQPLPPKVQRNKTSL